jgi:hypothetical protein
VMVMDLCLQRAPFGKQSKSRVDAAVMNLYDGWTAGIWALWAFGITVA